MTTLTSEPTMTPPTCAMLEARFQSSLNDALAKLNLAAGTTLERRASEPVLTESQHLQVPAAATLLPGRPLPFATARWQPQAAPPMEAAGADIEEAAAEQAAAAFWASQQSEACWLVPMGRDDSSSVFLRQCGMLQAMYRARRAGRTPLLIDRSPQHVVDSFYSYRHAEFLEGKQLFMEERGGTPRPELMERARKQLVNAMRHGLTLYIRLANSACDFVGRYSGDDTLPLAVFDQATVKSLIEEFAAGWIRPGCETREEGNNLFGSFHPLAAVLRPTDLRAFCFVPKV